MAHLILLLVLSKNSEKLKNSFFCKREFHMKIASLNNLQCVTEGVIWSVFFTFFNWAFYYRQVPVNARCQSTSDLCYVLNVVLLKSTQQVAFVSSTFTILQFVIFNKSNMNKILSWLTGFIAMTHLVVPCLCPLPDVGDPLDGVTQDKHCRANNHNQWGVNPGNTGLIPSDIYISVFQIHCLYTECLQS